MTVYQVNEQDQQIAFINGFAANDPESTGMIWEMILRRYPKVERRIAIVNCRADRPDRSEQLAESCLEWTPADHYFVVGTATNIFADRAIARGLDRNCVTRADQQPVENLVPRLHRVAGRSAMIMGMGNISGPGLELVRYYKDRTDLGRQITSLETTSIRKAA